MPMGSFRNKEEETTYYELQKMFRQLIQYQHKFCDFIHTNYQEIDLRSTSTVAQKFYAGI